MKKIKKQLTKLFCILNVVVILSLILPTQVFAYTTNSSSVTVKFNAVAANIGETISNFVITGSWSLSSKYAVTREDYTGSADSSWNSWSRNITSALSASIPFTYPTGAGTEKYGVDIFNDEGIYIRTDWMDLPTTIAYVVYSSKVDMNSGSGSGYFLPKTSKVSWALPSSSPAIHGQTLVVPVTVYPNTRACSHYLIATYTKAN